MKGTEIVFNLKIYDLVGCGTSFVLLAPVSERDILFIFLLFITYLFCLALQEGVRRSTKYCGFWPALS